MRLMWILERAYSSGSYANPYIRLTGLQLIRNAKTLATALVKIIRHRASSMSSSRILYANDGMVHLYTSTRKTKISTQWEELI